MAELQTMTARIALVAAASIAACVGACRSTPGTRAEPSAPSASAHASTEATQRDGSTNQAPPSGDAGAPSSAPAKLAPLAAAQPFASLPVAGFGDAVVSLPLGAREGRPVVVALHGNFDRPEWQCEVWRDITSGFPFVLCPRGIARTDVPKSLDRWTYGAAQKVEDELLAGLDALSAAFHDYIADGGVLFTAFSLGAIVGVRILQRHADRFPTAVLTEGGEKWSHAAATTYAKGGGQRVLFACGQSACKQSGAGAARILEKHEILARVVFGGNIGHTYDGKVADAIAEQWPWLVEGDPRWR
jgi:hypothetical protein